MKNKKKTIFLFMVVFIETLDRSSKIEYCIHKFFFVKLNYELNKEICRKKKKEYFKNVFFRLV